MRQNKINNTAPRRPTPYRKPAGCVAGIAYPPNPHRNIRITKMMLSIEVPLFQGYTVGSGCTVRIAPFAPAPIYPLRRHGRVVAAIQDVRQAQERSGRAAGALPAVGTHFSAITAIICGRSREMGVLHAVVSLTPGLSDASRHSIITSVTFLFPSQRTLHQAGWIEEGPVTVPCK